jgi:hypothetical protein
MTKRIKEQPAHDWAFKPRFRRGAFGWRGSSLAVQRVREAVSEIRKVARRDPLLGAEGAVQFLARVSPALEQIDSSSGAIGAAVNRAIDALAPIISSAPADGKTRAEWLDRLWRAHADDGIPYIECLADHWGELCASRDIASEWADQLIGIVRRCWSSSSRGHFHGASAALSALYYAERYMDLLDLLELDRLRYWPYREWGAKALVAMGRKSEAIRYAESCQGADGRSIPAIASFCEDVLLSSGFAEEAYRRYALTTGQRSTYLSTFRAVCARYPERDPKSILDDLVANTPGGEGKWFAAARDAGYLDTALRLAETSPCDPRTLARAARDEAESHPAFAVGAGLAALRWMSEGFGYELTGTDIIDAARHTLRAAERIGSVGKARERILRLMEGKRPGSKNFKDALSRLGELNSGS